MKKKSSLIKVETLKALLACENAPAMFSFLEKIDNLEIFMNTGNNRTSFPLLKIAAYHFFYLRYGRLPNIKYGFAFFSADDQLAATDLFETKKDAIQYAHKYNLCGNINDALMQLKRIKNDTFELIRMIFFIVAYCGNHDKVFNFYIFQNYCDKQDEFNIFKGVQTAQNLDKILTELNSAMERCKKYSHPKLIYHKLNILNELKNIYVKYRIYYSNFKNDPQLELPKPFIELFTKESIELLKKRVEFPEKTSFGYCCENIFVPLLTSNTSLALPPNRTPTPFDTFSYSEALVTKPGTLVVEPTRDETKKARSGGYLLPPPSYFLPRPYIHHENTCYITPDLRELTKFLKIIHNKIPSHFREENQKDNIFRSVIDFFNKSSILPVNYANLIILMLLQTTPYIQKLERSSSLILEDGLEASTCALVLISDELVGAARKNFEVYFPLDNFRAIQEIPSSKNNRSIDAIRYEKLIQTLFNNTTLTLSDFKHFYIDNEEETPYRKVENAILDCKKFIENSPLLNSKRINLHNLNLFLNPFNTIKNIYYQSSESFFSHTEFITRKLMLDTSFGRNLNHNPFLNSIQKISNYSNNTTSYHFHFTEAWLTFYRKRGKESFNFQVFAQKIEILAKNNYPPAIYFYSKICIDVKILISCLFEAGIKCHYALALADIGLILAGKHMLFWQTIFPAEFPGHNIDTLFTELCLVLNIPRAEGVTRAFTYLRMAAGRGCAVAQFRLAMLLKNTLGNNPEEIQNIHKELTTNLGLAMIRDYKPAFAISVVTQKTLPSELMQSISDHFLSNLPAFPSSNMLPENNNDELSSKDELWPHSLFELLKWQLINIYRNREDYFQGL